MLKWGEGETPGTLSDEAIINQQAFLNTAFMFFGVIVAFLLYHVYVLFQARRIPPYQYVSPSVLATIRAQHHRL